MKSLENTTNNPGQQDERTIFGEVLDWMLAPLLFLWPISIAATYYFSLGVANLPYDQELRERLASVVAQVRLESGGVSLSADASPVVRGVGSGKRWLRILRGDGADLAGSADLPVPSLEKWRAEGPNTVYFRDAEYRGQDIRLAYVVLGQLNQERNAWVLVELGETQEKRAILTNKIVASVIVPQFFLIPLALALVGFGLKRGLGPLGRLRDTLGGRDAGDLSPIPVRKVPEELEPLVESFNGMLRRMKRNADSQKRFIADAAHQIRTPLTGLKTQAQLAMRESDPQALKHALRQIANSVDRATRLSHQLLTLARTESGEIGQQKHEVLDLDRLLRDCIEDWVMCALEKEIDLGYEPRGEALVEGNAFLLRELVNNLIDNALRYTQPTGTVTCRVTHNGEFIILEVEDNGIGISLEQAELVFERFYRVDDAHSQGSGLGLAIVREIASQHGAYAALRPNPKGQGAVARVVFPAWISSPEVAESPAEENFTGLGT